MKMNQGMRILFPISIENQALIACQNGDVHSLEEALAFSNKKGIIVIE
jgi:hypothetical protein